MTTASREAIDARARQLQAQGLPQAEITQTIAREFFGGNVQRFRDWASGYSGRPADFGTGEGAERRANNLFYNPATDTWDTGLGDTSGLVGDREATAQDYWDRLSETTGGAGLLYNRFLENLPSFRSVNPWARGVIGDFGDRAAAAYALSGGTDDFRTWLAGQEGPIFSRRALPGQTFLDRLQEIQGAGWLPGAGESWESWGNVEDNPFQTLIEDERLGRNLIGEVMGRRINPLLRRSYLGSLNRAITGWQDENPNRNPFAEFARRGFSWMGDPSDYFHPGRMPRQPAAGGPGAGSIFEQLGVTPESQTGGGGGELPPFISPPTIRPRSTGLSIIPMDERVGHPDNGSGQPGILGPRPPGRGSGVIPRDPVDPRSAVGGGVDDLVAFDPLGAALARRRERNRQLQRAMRGFGPGPDILSGDPM